MNRPFKVARGEVVGGASFILSLFLAYLYLPGNSSALSGYEWLIVGCWLIIGVIFYLSTTRAYGRNSMREKMKEHLAP